VWDGSGTINIKSAANQIINGIKKGDVVTLLTPEELGNDVTVAISGAVTGESTFHVSCSDDDMDGPEDCGKRQGNGKKSSTGFINDWILAGMSGNNQAFDCPLTGPPGNLTQSKCVNSPPFQQGCKLSAAGAVEYQYTITNDSNEITAQVTSVKDDKLGELLSAPLILDPLKSKTLFATATISKTTVNKVDVVAVAAGTNLVCSAVDTLTVDVPPFPPATCSDRNFKPVKGLILVWTGNGPVDMTAASGQKFLGVQTGNEITINVAGLGNDIDVQIKGAVTGISTFHVSCSDSDMDGVEDCNKPQGNGKRNDSIYINQFLLQAMVGQTGAIICNQQTTGIVPPS
jgi:hypothetical protein